MRTQPGSGFHFHQHLWKGGRNVFYDAQGCPEHDTDRRQVNDRGYTWFDFDCDYCTGVWNYGQPNLPSQIVADLKAVYEPAPPKPEHWKAA